MRNATMRNKSFARFAAAFAVLMLIALPGFAARGTADFTHIAVIGDSYGAGFESNSLNQTHQVFSWPATVAIQTGATLCGVNSVATDNCFAQPLVSYPGIGPELVLVSLSPTIGQASGAGMPLVTAFGRPYNNLAIPGANVADTTTITGAEAMPMRGVELLARFILRGLGTEVDQAIAQKPTFILVWIGGNDFLGAVTAGTPKLLTPTATFTTAYNAMLDKLIAGAPNAGIVVGTLPTNPLAVPFLTTVPPFIVNPATRQPVLGPDGKPIYYVSDLGNGTFGQLPPGSFVTLPALAKIQTGVGIPAALKAVPPFNMLPNVGQPLTDNDTLTPDETATILGRVAEYNAAITAAASARNIPVADITGLFNRSVTGIQAGPFTFNASFILGGEFSLDGVHMTDIGYMFFANEYIKAINNGYGTHVPLASLTKFLANNGANFPNNSALAGQVYDTSGLAVTSDAASAMLQIMHPPQHKRTRAAGN
jgi:lysophospholipase L1-like esterase